MSTVQQTPDAFNQIPAFTIEQLKAAHSKVKSGADFPAYIQEIKAMGVTHYETYVNDGRTNYYGANNFTVKAPAKYDTIAVAENADMAVFKAELLAHQQGKTDFLTFIKMCAETGIEKWQISMANMTCIYFGKAGNEVLAEHIPQ